MDHERLTLLIDIGKHSLWVILLYLNFLRHSRASTSAPSDSLADDEALPTFEMSTNDLFIKDAFLVFRALCKLTMKPLNQERSVAL